MDLPGVQPDRVRMYGANPAGFDFFTPLLCQLSRRQGGPFSLSSIKGCVDHQGGDVKRREFIAASVAALSLRAAGSEVAQAATVPAPAQDPVKPKNRAEAIAIIADACKIVTPNG